MYNLFCTIGDVAQVIVYLLWYNDFEQNAVLGVFESQEKAQQWKEFFIENPNEDIISMHMGTALEELEEREYRLEITSMEVGNLDPRIKIDNLALLEFHEAKFNA